MRELSGEDAEIDFDLLPLSALGALRAAIHISDSANARDAAARAAKVSPIQRPVGIPVSSQIRKLAEFGGLGDGSLDLNDERFASCPAP